MIYLLPLLSTLLTSVAITTTPNTGDQTNGFLFDYLRSYPAPLPVIESCPAQLQFAPVTVPFGGAEPAPPFTAMYVFRLSLLLLISPSLSSSPSLTYLSLLLPSWRQSRGRWVRFVLILRFLVNEAFIGNNGTVDNRMYTYSTSFTNAKETNPVNLPFMNGTQFMVCMWVRALSSFFPCPFFSLYQSAIR